MLPERRPRIFLDSNVIFSGLYSAEGAPGVILERYIQGELRLVISPQVLEEVVRTVKEKLPAALLALSRLLMSIPPEICPDPSRQEVIRWAEVMPIADAAILSAAVAAQPDCLVTGDKHFLENPGISERTGLNIVTPAQFLEWLEKGTEPS